MALFNPLIQKQVPGEAFLAVAVHPDIRQIRPNRRHPHAAKFAAHRTSRKYARTIRQLRFSIPIALRVFTQSL
jgi:hypothetical protein